jgi:hypothetical protein
MRVYRTVAPPPSSVSRFLSTIQEMASVSYLAPAEMIDQIFARKPSPIHFSRFCPKNTTSPGVYVTEEARASFFEYSHYQLANRPFTGSEVVGAALYQMEMTNHPPMGVDLIKTIAPPGVLSANDPTYAAAHAWLGGLTPFPDWVRYPSVRDPSNGACWVLFKKHLIASTNFAVTRFAVNPIASTSRVQFISPDGEVILLQLNTPLSQASD